MKVLKSLLYIIGFVIYIACLTALNKIGTTEWLLGIGASFGVLLFSISQFIDSK